MEIHIVGSGRSGKAALDLAQKEGYSSRLYETDADLDESFCDILVVSPGIPLSKESIQKKKRRGAEVIGEVEFASRHSSHSMIGVTGTNGKTTAVNQIAKTLTAHGREAVACGNNGYPLSEAILTEDEETMLVVELSSYQLETLITPCLDVALILNIAPDHLNRYADFTEYANTKCRIKWALKKNGVLFVDQNTLEQFGDELNIPQRVRFVSSAVSDVVSHVLGKEVEIIESRLPHRLEYIAEGVINDSKATNVAAVVHALQSMKGSVVLILGGQRKGEPFTPILEFDDKIERCIIFGADAQSIAQELSPPLQVEVVKTVEESVQKGIETVTKKAEILFSPGCASFDTHQNYEKRGEAFKDAIYALKGIVHEQA